MCLSLGRWIRTTFSLTYINWTVLSIDSFINYSSICLSIFPWCRLESAVPSLQQTVSCSTMICFMNNTQYLNLLFCHFGPETHSIALLFIEFKWYISCIHRWAGRACGLPTSISLFVESAKKQGTSGSMGPIWGWVFL